MGKFGADKKISVFWDCGSGLNPERKGLIRLMDAAANGKITTIVISYKDRITRFGYAFLMRFFRDLKINIYEAEQPPISTIEEQLTQDMMSLLASFSGKLYSARAKRNRKSLETKILV